MSINLTMTIYILYIYIISNSLEYCFCKFQDRFTENDMNGIVNGGGTYEEEIMRKSGYPGANSPNCAANVDR